MRLRSRRNLRLFACFFFLIFPNTNTCGSSTCAFLVHFLNTNACGSSTRAFFFSFFGSSLKHKYAWDAFLFNLFGSSLRDEDAWELHVRIFPNFFGSLLFLNTHTCGSAPLCVPPPCAARRGKEKKRRRRPSRLGTVAQTEGEPHREREGDNTAPGA